MRSLKRMFVLPADLLEQFEQEVPARQRNAIIADLLQGWLGEQRPKFLRDRLIAGCRDMAKIYLKVEREYHPLEEEVQQALEPPLKRKKRR